MKKQIVVIHGGHAFNSRESTLDFLKKRKISARRFKLKSGWKEKFPTFFNKKVGLFSPQMPNKESAKYAEWEVWFKRMLPFLKNDLIFVGHSLGGKFLVKYLSENTFPKRIKGLFLVAAPFEGRNRKHVGNSNFLLKGNLQKCANQADKVFIYHSKDDAIVPFSDLKRYVEKFPEATSRVFLDRGHFNQNSFPELIKDIKSLFKK